MSRSDASAASSAPRSAHPQRSASSSRRARRGGAGTASSAAADVGQRAGRAVDRAEQCQQALGARERGAARRIEPGDRVRVAQAPGAQLEQRAAEIEAQDLRRLALEPRRVLAGGPQAQAAARGRAPGAAGALLGRGAADRRQAQAC